LKICVDFKKLNTTTKKDTYSLPFIKRWLIKLLDMKFIPF
jgi:hypothetical protein